MILGSLFSLIAMLQKVVDHLQRICKLVDIHVLFIIGGPELFLDVVNVFQTPIDEFATDWDSLWVRLQLHTRFESSATSDYNSIASPILNSPHPIAPTLRHKNIVG